MPLIVLEGLDGSGKQTQSNLLYKCLSKTYKTHKIDFPRYDNPSSYLVREHLKGATSENASLENPYACELYYAADRVISSQTEEWANWLKQNHVVISDRYNTASMIYQAAKLPAKNRIDFARWVYDLETNKLRLPKPDLIMYIQMKPQLSQELMKARYHGDESEKDEYEKNADLQKRCYETASIIAKEFNWHTITCDDGNMNLRSIDDIHNDILQTVRASGILCQAAQNS